MPDDLWNRRRELLVADLQRAATALLDHTHAASFCIPWGTEGHVIFGGSPESIAELVKTAHAPHGRRQSHRCLT